ncbi:Spherulation-specific family 4-domain-containing protein [Mycena albidolilacea]|uniref:Spherulation-specific family 4-domain-containing protein n=1 Tax=Mycena albidolilacea TaxID=1033008 RepID=A0AAD6ZJ08_9AGAR|nr:Spherulation-specific family 4-domain-containing protein [Mycena albidolilacea]
MCCCLVSILLIQLFIVQYTHALGILLPLYVSPGANCAAWSPVFDAISANANTQWYIIVNPDSGPGSFDQLYETCVSKIPTSANQITMGYVDTTGGNVLRDIDTYAGWPSSSRPHGIFFDDISPTTKQLGTYQSYVSHAKSQGFTFIGLDPGQTVADSSYFSIADLINTYEDSYSSFNPDSLSGTLSKQSVTLVNSPTTGSYSTVISQLESKDVAAVYISTASDSIPDLPSQLSGFASEVASVGGGATSSGSTGTNSGSTGSTGGSSGSTTGSGTNSGSTSSGSASPGSNPESGSSGGGTSSGLSTPSTPNTSGSGSGPSSTVGSSSVSSKSPSNSQSASGKGNLETSSAQSPSLSGTPGVTKPNQPGPAPATRKGPPIPAIVGGVLGAFIILLILLLIFWCMRRRRFPSVSPETAVPFTEVRSTILMPPDAAFTKGSTIVPVPAIESTSGDNYETVDTNLSARLSAAPIYGLACESLADTSGPPPSYHN